MNILAPKKERVYVKVTSDFDSTGYMQPRAITWEDGRIFAIDQVRNFMPRDNSRCNCYVVVIGRKERELFYEPISTDHQGSRVERWFVETSPAHRLHQNI